MPSKCTVRSGHECIHVEDINDLPTVLAALRGRLEVKSCYATFDDGISRSAKRVLQHLELSSGQSYTGLGQAVSQLRGSLQGKTAKRIRELHQAFSCVRHFTELGEEKFVDGIIDMVSQDLASVTTVPISIADALDALVTLQPDVEAANACLLLQPTPALVSCPDSTYAEDEVVADFYIGEVQTHQASQTMLPSGCTDCITYEAKLALLEDKISGWYDTQQAGNTPTFVDVVSQTELPTQDANYDIEILSRRAGELEKLNELLEYSSTDDAVFTEAMATTLQQTLDAALVDVGNAAREINKMRLTLRDDG